MVFRRRRPFRRRFRRHSETYTTMQCRVCRNIYGDSPCSAPLTDVMEVLTMRSSRSPTDTTEVTNASDRFLVVDGISFESVFFSDPLKWFNTGSCDPSPLSLSFFLTIYEAIVVLPLAAGTAGVPAYLPELSFPTNQGGDVADRVLWKRITLLPMWGLNFGDGHQLTGTMRDTNAGPVRVKSKVRLDDRHGLYYVTNYVHDLAGLISGDFNSCTPVVEGNDCVIPVENSSWWKIFYHSRK